MYRRTSNTKSTAKADSSDATLDLRTPNSFCRLLAHKLADYYALTHHVDGAMNGVKLYRTPYCRM